MKKKEYKANVKILAVELEKVCVAANEACHLIEEREEEIKALEAELREKNDLIKSLENENQRVSRAAKNAEDTMLMLANDVNKLGSSLKIESIVSNEKVTVVRFADGEVTKAFLDKRDKKLRDENIGIAICVAKKAMNVRRLSEIKQKCHDEDLSAIWKNLNSPFKSKRKAAQRAWVKYPENVRKSFISRYVKRIY